MQVATGQGFKTGFLKKILSSGATGNNIYF